MIKVTVGEQKTQSEKPFPKLMISTSDRIVFMVKFRHGFMLHEKGEGWGVGYYSESWAMEDFTDYNEPITLQNA
jgi:hypothetical protein